MESLPTDVMPSVVASNIQSVTPVEVYFVLYLSANPHNNLEFVTKMCPSLYNS
jgi:hypothetical protein